MILSLTNIYDVDSIWSHYAFILCEIRPGTNAVNQPKRPTNGRRPPNVRRAQTADNQTSDKLDGIPGNGRMMRRKNPNRCYNKDYKGKTMTQVLVSQICF